MAAASQPVKVAEAEALASDVEVESPCSFTQTRMLKTPGACPAVSQNQLGSALNRRPTVHVPPVG